MSEFVDRIDRVRTEMADRGIDGIVVTHPTNRRYLTGFTADDIPPNESAGYVLVSSDRQDLVTSSVNTSQAAAQAPHVAIVRRGRGWAKHIADFIIETELHRVGYEPHAMLEGVFRQTNELLVEDGYRVEWVDADGLVDDIRKVKSQSEVELLRKAFEITCDAFNEVSASIEAGMTEIEIARAFDAAMVERGAEGPSFPTIVASGPNAARPHHEPGSRTIQNGEPIIIDMGALYEGYCADLTRTVWVGEADEEFGKIYRLVYRANDAVIERAHPGMTGKELDSFARDHITAGGYGDEFSHSLGHGVGLRVHEGQNASVYSEDTMEPGNTLTIEPGIYVEDWGGVRIEDVVLFTDEGFELLTESAKKFPIPE
ncbi:MAG: Xaa-Pro peptidase family protein [Thermomicrobiales bacterium]